MKNTIDEAMCFIHDQDAKRGAYWSDATDALADAMVEYAALKIAELATTDSQQLQAKIRAIVLETEAAQNGTVDAGEILSDLVADLRVLSAM